MPRSALHSQILDNMSAVDARAIVSRFNRAINSRDLDSLAALMTGDHRFTDTEEHTIEGKDTCVEAWRAFFDAFPDYRNVFEEIVARADVVALRGYSTCAFEQLAGPALWRALVRDGQVAEWRVYEDTPTTRSGLGFGQATTISDFA
jgi:ketosteroid isomerase-like protein